MLRRIAALFLAVSGFAQGLCAESVRVLDLMPGGCAPLRQIALQLALDGESGVDSVSVERPKNGVRAAIDEWAAGKADFILLAEDRIPDDCGGRRRPLLCEAAGIYVNSTNPVRGVTSAQARALLTAKRPVWQSLNGSAADIQRIGVKSERGERETVTRMLNLKPEECSGEIFRVGTMPEAVLLVSVNENAMGFGRLLPEAPASVKALAVDGAAPTLDGLKSGAYPLRKVYVLLEREPHGSAAAGRFAAALESADFAALIAENGFFPVR